MNIRVTYLLAMREQAPQMFKELSRTGALEAHLNAITAEAQQMFEYLTEGLPKNADGTVKDMNAGRCVEEQVRAALIEFPLRSQSNVGGVMLPQPPREMDERAAIRAFAKVRSLAMAEEVAEDLRSRAPSDIFGDDIGAESIWDEYCHEARNGPTIELADAWSSLLDPLIADLVERLPYEETVLLTIAAQWQTDLPEFDYGEGRYSANPDMIAQAIRACLFRVARDSDWDAHDATDEDEEPV